MSNIKDYIIPVTAGIRKIESLSAFKKLSSKE